MFSRGFCSGSDPFSSPREWITSELNRPTPPGKTPERKMIQMIQVIQMIVFSRFLFLARPARIGPRVDCIGAELAHPTGENTRTENDSNDPNDSNDCFLDVFVPDPRGSHSTPRELHRDSIGPPRRAKHGKGKRISPRQSIYSSRKACIIRMGSSEGRLEVD